MIDGSVVSGLVAAVLGHLLGLFFFGGLWWTVRRAVVSRRPSLWFVCSMALRNLVAVTGVLIVGRAQWVSMLLCLLGFVVARPMVTRLTRPAIAGPADHTAPANA